MPSNQTQNYQLSQWVKSDQVQMEDFNADNAKIDAALKAEADARAALAAQVALRGNCKIWTTTYKGTGQSGSEHPNKLTFPEKPLFALVFEGDGDFMPLIPGSTGSIYHTAGSGSDRLIVQWSGNTAKWYIQDTPYKQMNRQGTLYTVFAFMKAD